jgi:transcriptional regulator with XRE-family HTH domain
MRKANGLLKDLRHTLGLTQEGLVDRLDEYLTEHGINAAPDVRSVTAWESGAVRWPHPHYRAALRAILGVDDDAALGFHLRSAGTPPRVLMQVLDPDTEDPMKRQTFMTGLASVALGAANGQPLQPWLAMERSHSVRPTLIGSTDVEAIQRTAEEFASRGNVRGGAALVDAMLGHLNWAATLLDQGRFATTHVRAQLSSAVAHLANTAGFNAYDAGLHAQARRALTMAVHAATEADDQSLRAYALADMARQAITLGHPGQALDLLALATHGARDTAAPALRAKLHAITARAHGRAGDTPATLHQIAQGEDAYAPPTSEDPSWLRACQPAEAEASYGVALFEAALHQGTETSRAQALQRLTAAANAHEPRRPRSAALCRARIATLHFQAGDLEPAVAEARAFTTLAHGINSARLREDRAMLARHAHPHLGAPAVADLLHTLQAS